jgi:hypothetical protein
LAPVKRATISIPDELATSLDAYLSAQETRPTLTVVVQAALQEYLALRGFGTPTRALRITPAPRGSGRSDVSVEHDRELAAQ